MPDNRAPSTVKERTFTFLIVGYTQNRQLDEAEIECAYVQNCKNGIVPIQTEPLTSNSNNIERDAAPLNQHQPAVTFTTKTVF